MTFRNPGQALRWAYEVYNRPEYATDARAEAVLLLSLCERVLPALHMAYVRSQFGREASGFDLLAQHLAGSLGTGQRGRESIEKIIRAYCGEKIGLREIRKSMACGMLKATSYRNQAYDTLDAIHAQAMDRLRSEMDTRGFIALARRTG